MRKFQSLIETIDQACSILNITMEQRRYELTQAFSQQIAVTYQKVSLAEKRMQVKNARSPEN